MDTLDPTTFYMVNADELIRIGQAPARSQFECGQRREHRRTDDLELERNDDAGGASDQRLL